MEQYIPKAAVVAEIDNLIDKGKHHDNYQSAFRDGNNSALYALKVRIDTLEVKDPYEQCIQYASIEAGIKAHAEEYSFNIESKLFNQLTKEQQALWRKEIEEACISGGYNGLNLAKDPRYKENLEVKEVKLTWKDMRQIVAISDKMLIQKGNLDDKGFYEAVLEQFKAQKGE